MPPEAELIEARFGRVIVPLTEEQVAVAWQADSTLADRVIAYEHREYRNHADSDISQEDAMSKLLDAVISDIGLGGKWIAWRQKPIVSTERDYMNNITIHRAFCRFSYCPL